MKYRSWTAYAFGTWFISTRVPGETMSMRDFTKWSEDGLTFEIEIFVFGFVMPCVPFMLRAVLAALDYDVIYFIHYLI